MTTKEIVHVTVTGFIISLIIIFIIYGIVSCSQKEAESPYTTTITVTSQRDFNVLDNDIKTIANIEISNEYSFMDYQMDYENDRLIINLKKANPTVAENEDKE